jgi:hypothetical protein
VTEPAPAVDASTAAVERAGRRERWSAPRLSRLDAAATAVGGGLGDDGVDAGNVSS